MKQTSLLRTIIVSKFYSKQKMHRYSRLKLHFFNDFLQSSSYSLIKLISFHYILDFVDIDLPNV